MRNERRPNRSLLFVCLVCVAVVAAGVGAGLVAANGTYDLTVDDAVDTPSRTVENPFDSSITDEIDAFAVREPGESVDVRVTAPDGESFDMDLYTEAGYEKGGPSGTGSETVTFDTTGLSPGTYSLALDADSNLQAFHPVVISGYDIEFSLPSEAEAGETVEVDDISVTPTELSSDPAGVELVVWNDDRVERFDASGSDGSYSASADLSEFEPGTYNVHVAALGDDTFRGQPEILGMSEGRTIEVNEPETSGGGDDTDGTSGGGGSSGGGGVAPSDPSTGGDGQTGENGSGDSENGSESTTPTETVELVDEAPDEPGIRVSFENATTRAVTLTNESASGNVTVADRSDLPDDSSPPAGSAVAIVEITVPESERDTPATIELAVDAGAVNATDNLTVERYHAENDTWTQLETSVTETSETTITITAETPGFSIFAVTETAGEPTADDNGTDSSNSTDNETDGSTSDGDDSVITPTEQPDDSSNTDGSGSESGPEDQPGFGFVAAVLALSALVIARYSNH